MDLFRGLWQEKVGLLQVATWRIEIRRTMRIREGDPLEIYTDKDGEVIFKSIL